MVNFVRHQKVVHASDVGIWLGYYRKMRGKVFVYVFDYRDGKKSPTFYVDTEKAAKQVFINITTGDTR